MHIFTFVLLTLSLALVTIKKRSVFLCCISQVFLEKCSNKRQRKANNWLTVIVQPWSSSSPVGNLSSPYTFSKGFTPSIGVGPATFHMVAHTVIASSSSYEVFCARARICSCARMCTLAVSLFYSTIALSSSVRGPQGLALWAPEMKSSVYVR